MNRGLAVAAMLGLAMGTAGAAAPAAAGEWIPAWEFSHYGFVADTRDALSTVLNPAGLSGGVGTNLYLDLSGSSDDLDEVSTALQGGPWGFAYRHRDLHDWGPRRVGGADPYELILPDRNLDEYVFGVAAGPRWLQLGVSRVWGNVDQPGHDRRSWVLGMQSRPDRRLALGFTVENPGRPDYLGGELTPRYRYGVAVRPLPADPELLTLNVEGSNPDGSAAVDMAYGARFRLSGGLDLGFTVEDRNGVSPEFGLTATAHFGHGAAAARARTVEGREEDVRGSVVLQAFDEFWRRSIPARGRVAVLRLQGSYEDEASGFVLLGGESRGALDVIRRIDDAARDPDVSGLALRIGGLSGSFLGPVSAQYEEIRKAVTAFRASGKPVVAYLEDRVGASEMYVASAADRIVMPPLTGIQGIGVSVHLDRLKRMFEKIGVEWDADTAGAYKGTFHTWYTDTTTTAQREEILGLVDVAYDHLVDTIRESRGIDPGEMASIATGRIVMPEECVSAGLVDTLGWWDDALALAGRLLGEPPGTKPPHVPLPDRRYRMERWVPPPAVAVVTAYGDIVSGTSGRNWLYGGRTMGSETVVAQLRAAASNPEVKAIVFRVDSGGGSALASAEIGREVRRVRAERKLPVIVSMGGAAASGGYWISMDADTILADAMTVTGSIGVVYTLPVLAGLYEKMGVTSETFKRGEHTDMLSWNRHYTPEEAAMMHEATGYLYDRFVEGVARGRGLSEDRVREIGQGRVYFGERAMDLGLVDGIGTLSDAERVAAGRAGIAGDYRVLTYSAPEGTGWFRRILTWAGLGGSLRPGPGSLLAEHP